MSPLRSEPDAAEILSWLRDFLHREFGTLQERVTPESNFADDLRIDSLDGVVLLLNLEERFDVSIPDDAAGRICTVADAIACVEASGADASYEVANGEH